MLKIIHEHFFYKASSYIPVNIIFYICINFYLLLKNYFIYLNIFIKKFIFLSKNFHLKKYFYILFINRFIYKYKIYICFVIIFRI